MSDPSAVRHSGIERRPVTVLFCDLVGSTGIGEHVDPESYHAIMTNYFSAIDAVVRAHDGHTEKFIGDAVMAVFGLDVVRDDDALRALEAAISALAAVDALDTAVALPGPGRLAARCGVNTGPVLVNDGITPDTLIGGDVVNVAARLQALAGPGEILLTDTTARWAGPAARCGALARRAVRGRRDPVEVRSLLGVDRRGLRRRHRPLVGRNEELAVLSSVTHRALARHRPAVCAVVGSPGVGKTRLVAESVGRLGPATVVVDVNRPQDGAGTNLRWVCDHLTGTGPVADRAPGEPRTDELDGLALPGGTVVFLDDAHRAEPELAERVAQLLAEVHHLPMVVLLAGRAHSAGVHPWWQIAGRDVTVLWLDELDPDAGRELIEQIYRDLEPDGLQPDVMAHAAPASDELLDHAGGNPLFLEELISAGIDGRDRRELPPTIEAVVVGRLSRLARSEFFLAQQASVLGTHFTFEELASLARLSGTDRGPLHESLHSLWQYEVFREPAGDARHWSFTSDVLRQAAYSSIPRERRLSLHLEVAGWANGPVPPSEPEHEVAVGHLELAARELEALRPGDPALVPLADQAAEQLTELAHRALDRNDPVSADERAHRGLAAARGRAALDAVLLLGSDVRALRGDRIAAAAALERIAPTAGVDQLVIEVAAACLEPDDPLALEHRAQQVQGILTGAGLARGTTRVLAALGLAAELQGRSDTAADHLEAALSSCGSRGRPWQRNVLVTRLARAYGRGSLPVTAAAERIEAMRTPEDTGPGSAELAAWSSALRHLANPDSEAGTPTDPLPSDGRVAALVAADAALLSGELTRAEDMLRAVGPRPGDLPVGGRLAFALARSGRHGEAIDLIAANQLAPNGLQHPRVWRSAQLLRLARSEILADRGLFDQAVGTTLGAWSVAARTDDRAIAALVAGTVGRLSRPLDRVGSQRWERVAARLAGEKGLDPRLFVSEGLLAPQTTGAG
jgi:class 3 adenylate cyclase